jgi:acetolactate synthase-1/2/3 large subunit
LVQAEAEALSLVQKLGFPVVPTWGIIDLLPSNESPVVGPFGLHGTRYGNFAVQNADLILAVGTRLDTHETGSPLSSFAREAKKIIVDIDPTELKKFEALGLSTDQLIAADAKEFLTALLDQLKGFSPPDISEWKSIIAQWKKDFSICPPEYYEEKTINPYVFVKALAGASREGDTFVIDTGCAVAWMTQAFEFKKNQRMYAAFNNTPMGYALPASIGASLALGEAPVTCVVGDGSILMNIQELPTIIKHKLPIKIFLINNQGYSMIQQTQDQWLKSKYVGSSASGDLAFPDFEAVAKAYGFPVLRIDSNENAAAVAQEVISSSGPFFCNVTLRAEHRVIPQVVYGRPIEDAGPVLPRDQFLKNMIVKPMPVSLKE